MYLNRVYLDMQPVTNDQWDFATTVRFEPFTAEAPIVP